MMSACSGIDIGNLPVNHRIGTALARFLRHGSDRLVLAGSIALAAQTMRLSGERIARSPGDIDILVTGLDSLAPSLATEFICPHVHGTAAPGKTLVQLVHPKDAVRIDIFRAIGHAASRAMSFRFGTYSIPVLSVEDQAARAASVCIKLARGDTAVAKHLPDFVRLRQLVASDQIDVVWREYRRDFEPQQFRDAAAQIEAAAHAHPERLIDAAFNRDVNAVCPSCAPWGAFVPAAPARTFEILGYV